MNAAELARPDSDSEADALSRCAAHPDHADDFLATRGKRVSRPMGLLESRCQIGKQRERLQLLPLTIVGHMTGSWAPYFPI